MEEKKGIGTICETVGLAIGILYSRLGDKNVTFGEFIEHLKKVMGFMDTYGFCSEYLLGPLSNIENLKKEFQTREEDLQKMKRHLVFYNRLDDIIDSIRVADDKEGSYA